MPKYGQYETVRQLSTSPLGAVYAARMAGASGSADFAIKVLQPPPAAMEQRLVDEHVRLFLARAKVQQQVAATSSCWAPIHDAAAIPGGAYYVTNLYAQSAQRLVGRVRLTPALLYNLTSGVLHGLADLQKACGRGHGRLELPKTS